MEIVVALFVIVGGSIAFSAWMKSRSSGNSQPVDDHDGPKDGSPDRKCHACGYQGKMKTWIANYKAPKFYLLLGFVCGYIPGLIFLALYWGKYKCPSCGAIGKNQQDLGP
jgi:hypothetical protein